MLWSDLNITAVWKGSASVTGSSHQLELLLSCKHFIGCWNSESSFARFRRSSRAQMFEFLLNDSEGFFFLTVRRGNCCICCFLFVLWFMQEVTISHEFWKPRWLRSVCTRFITRSWSRAGVHVMFWSVLCSWLSLKEYFIPGVNTSDPITSVQLQTCHFTPVIWSHFLSTCK